MSESGNKQFCFDDDIHLQKQTLVSNMWCLVLSVALDETLAVVFGLLCHHVELFYKLGTSPGCFSPACFSAGTIKLL